MVCLEGPDRGRDFRLHAEKNFIGRSPGMDVCILSDDTAIEAGTHSFRSVVVGSMRAEPVAIVDGAAEQNESTSQELIRRIGRLWNSATGLRSPAAQ
jgi:hypothetical protein